MGGGRRSWWVGAVAALAVAGCAGAGTHGAAPRSGPEWRELTTAHFVLRTDVTSEIAHRVIGELELERALLVVAMPELAAVQRRIEVVAFASREEFWEATGLRSDYVGQATHDGMGRQRLVLQVNATGDVEEHAVQLTHELAHALTLHVVPRQPVWLAEGLACYLSSVARVIGGRRWVGALPEDGYPSVDPLPTRAAFAWDAAGQGRETRLYVTAWRLVRYLATERSAGLVELERRLAAGAPEEEAWNAAFPGLRRDAEGLARLDRALLPWSADLPGARREIRARTAEAPPSERLLGPGAAHTVRLRVRLAWERPALEREVGAALRIDPDHVAALAYRAAWNPAEKLSLARRAVAAHAEDAQAWALLASALSDDPAAPEVVAARRKAVELGPDDPVSLGELAWAVGPASGEEGEALAARAVRLAPWSPGLLHLHAWTLARVGRCAEERDALARGAALGSGGGEDAWGPLRAATEQACGAGPGARPGRAPAGAPAPEPSSRRRPGRVGAPAPGDQPLAASLAGL